VGSNPYGQFGMGSTQSTDSVPVSLGFDASGQRFITAISVGLGGNSICALTDLGTVYCAGLNGTGQLGNGTTASSTTPVQVSGLGNVTALASNSNGACALKGDGTVWCWGYNGYGGLGNGTGTPSSTPVQVSGLSSVIAVSGGSGHTCALKSEGTVWCWGWNGDGQLGDGTITNRALPVQVQF
jgi:alpha-tubulin suppressor-like RCC1 family protein